MDVDHLAFVSETKNKLQRRFFSLPLLPLSPPKLLFTYAVAKPYYYNSYYEPNLYLDATDDCLLWLEYSYIVNIRIQIKEEAFQLCLQTHIVHFPSFNHSSFFMSWCVNSIDMCWALCVDIVDIFMYKNRASLWNL